MLTRARELWLALLACILIALLYTAVVVRTGSIPAAREFFGHSLGVLGLTLMLMTETLYSLRKRTRIARWGRMAVWLQFHIFTGLVGPFMALLHTSWKFNGLAGVVMLLTVVIVISGFIGRYIYTAVPRTADGAVLQARELTEQIRRVEQELAEAEQAARAASPHSLSVDADFAALVYPVDGEKTRPRPATSPETGGLPLPATGGSFGVILGRAFSDGRMRFASWQARRRIDPALRVQYRQAENLIRQRRVLQRQVQSLAAARRLLGIWHAVHIPIGMALFTATAAHIAAALYYATFLR